ncbi:hypothetical protein PMAYCL1PPCAC_32835, partial [Pristionchus mayeri]
QEGMMLPLLLSLFLFFPPLVIADYPCPGNYTWYRGPDNFQDGYCVTYSDDFLLDGPQAIKYCEGMGAFAPSIHNQKQLDYWSGMTVTAGVGHYWLGTNCPHESDPYTWTDKSRTDYFGPNKELLSCKKGTGFHIHDTGFVLFALVDDPTSSSEQFSAAPALCAYPFTFTTTPEPEVTTTTVADPDDVTTAEPEVQTTTTTATQRPTTTTTTPTTTTRPTTTTTVYTPPLPDLTEAYCNCEPSTVYLDVVFVVDNSADMTNQMLGAAVAAIQSSMFGVTFGDKMFQTQVAIVSFASDVKVVVEFGDLKSQSDIFSWNIPHSTAKSTKMSSAIDTATSIVSKGARDFTRGVIVLISNSYNQLDDANLVEASDAFQDDGGVFISIDYSTKGELAGLKKIASPGYYLNNKNADSVEAQILYAFCDANCFCSDGLTAYDTTNERGTPQGCFHAAMSAAVYDAADENCQNEKGFVATVHDADKNFFLLSLFDKSKKYWIGYKRTNGAFKWEDNSKETYTNWAPGNPVSNKDCVFAQQTSGFNTQWLSADCRDPINASHLYACQLRPCDSTYNCWI